MNRPPYLRLFVAAAVLAAQGCGSSAPSSPTPSPAPVAAPSPAPTPAPSPVPAPSPLRPVSDIFGRWIGAGAKGITFASLQTCRYDVIFEFTPFRNEITGSADVQATADNCTQRPVSSLDRATGPVVTRIWGNVSGSSVSMMLVFAPVPIPCAATGLANDADGAIWTGRAGPLRESSSGPDRGRTATVTSGRI